MGIKLYAVEDYYFPGGGIVVRARDEDEAVWLAIQKWGNRDEERLRVFELFPWQDGPCIYEWEGA